LSRAVKIIIISCGIVYFLQLISQVITGRSEMNWIFGLTPVLVWKKFFVWQLFTYAFLHGGIFHLLFNMFALWMFGCELERYWGTRKFIKYALVTGIGAGISTVIVTPNLGIPTIGASGVVYGILLAYGLLFPNRLIYLYFLFPIKAKHFVLIFGVIELFASLSGPADNIAHLAHLGGMLFGFGYLRYYSLLSGLRQYYYQNKLKKLRGKFRVIDREDDSDDFGSTRH
ncbi:MAG: rhomboid family intramembrane serine protease, partial [Deltaproteobacteria bacterium]